MNRYLFIPFNILSIFILLAIVSSQRASAQSLVRGAMQGAVREAGAPTIPVPGAQVTIVNLDTGFTAKYVTAGDGIYNFELIPPGEYRISAQTAGYEQTANSTVERFTVVFSVRSVVTPPPIELRKSSAQPSPTVQPPPALVPTPPVTTPTTASPSPYIRLVNLEDASRSANFDDRLILALPFFGSRTFDQLALLAAGVAPSPQAIGDTVGPGVGPGVGTSGQFTVNGLRSRANNFTVDGSDNNDEDIGVRRQGFTALVPQAVESLQGYYIATLLPHSQFGRNLGAQVNAISRGGGQQFHGTIYGFLTDRRLKARDAFDLTGGSDDVLRRANGQPVLLDDGRSQRQIPLPNPVGGESPFTRAQYGFVVSGPLSARKTFFFGSFERRDINATRESNFAVPTVAERGLFGSGETGLRVRVGNQTREAFPTSVVGDAYFSLFPFANNPRGPYGRNTYTEQAPASADGAIFSLKLDQQFKAFGKEHSFTGRYNFTNDETTLPVTGEALFSTLRARVRTQNLSLFLTSAPHPQVSNEFRFSYGRTRLNFREVRNAFLQSSRLRNTSLLLNARKLSNGTLPGDPQTIFEPRSINPDPSCSGSAGAECDTDPIGQVIVSGFSPIGADVNSFPQSRVNNTFQAADTVFYNAGRQRVIGGVDFRRTELNSQLDRNFRPVAVFNGSLDVAPAGSRLSPNGFYQGADFVAVGATTGFLQTQSLVPDSTIGLRFWQANVFALDQISLRPNFKLTLGLRYEVNTVPEEVDRRVESTFTSSEAGRFIAEEKRLYGVSGFETYLGGRQSIFRRDLNNVSPHLAFAWDPSGDGKTAVRGGYGIYFDQVPGAVISQSRSVFPRFLTINFAGVSPDQGVIAFNPQRLSKSGTLNTFEPGGAFGRDLLEALLTLNRLSNPRLNYFPATPGFVLPTADLVTPYAQHWGLTVEREARRNLLLSLAYAGTRGIHLLRLATPNFGPNAIPFVDGGVLGGQQITFNGSFVSPGPNFRRPFPLLGSFTSIESDANSIYHSLQAEASMRLTRGVQFTSAYTWSHAIDETSDLFELAGARGLPQDSLNRGAERGDANFDVRHRFAQSFIWDLPFFTRSKVFGGWQLAGIVTLQTGQPFTVISSVDVNLDGNLTDRLHSLSGVSEAGEGSLRYRFPATPLEQFRLLAGAGANGAVGRNTFRATGIANTDLAINKFFRFTERHQMELRTEIFNLFNRTHFGIPAHVLFAPGLGRAVNTTVPARTVQFAVRYKF